MKQPADIALAYPAPSIVLGVGRMGLAVLEQLGADWEQLEQSGGGPSLKNLRLVHVRADAGTAEATWRRAERPFVQIARHTGEGDLPTLALDLIILRALGLVRYRNGVYQVAMPQDHGVVEVPVATRDGGWRGQTARRRYFEWQALSPDPIAAAERLRVLRQKDPDLDLFVSPLVNRIRQGHSPRAMLACISRCRALSEGRDPWPWGWLFAHLSDLHTHASAPAPGAGGYKVGFQRDWLVANDLHGFLDGHAEAPLERWKSWRAQLERGSEIPALQDVALPSGGFDLTVPQVFVPRASDLSAPLDALELLQVDWEATGWATRDSGVGEPVHFAPVQASRFRLGFFDHDDCSRVHTTNAEQFAARLKELARHVHRGLVRMWVDLQRDRVETSEELLDEVRYRAHADDSLTQSLEILGELLVRPLIEDSADADFGEDADAADASESSAGAAANNVGAHLQANPLASLAATATPFLRRLQVEKPSEQNVVRNALNQRLAELGFDAPAQLNPGRALFHDIALSPEDIYQPAPSEPAGARGGEGGAPATGLLALRSLLNRETRNLYDFSFLKTYRTQSLRRVPRLTIYVVADASEVFARRALRPILREIHAELLRAFGPIFETFYEGFDRALSVVPIIWMPHPADTFGGEYPAQNRGEEAAIIETVQGVRRWVESVPRGKRCVPQIFVNSRVTDNAVLSVWDSVRQTHDFLNFQVRNDLAQDHWLRRTATASRGDDLFASFSCLGIAFPAEKAREYLANRYARHSLSRLQKGEQGRLPDVSSEPIAPPELGELVREPQTALAQDTVRAADAMRGKVEGRVDISARTTVDQVEHGFGEHFEQELHADIQHQWRNFTRRRGQMDEMVDALRRDTSTHLADTLDVVVRVGDRLIDEHASKGGLRRAYAGFDELHAIARNHLQSRESKRRDMQDVCLRHRIPSTAALRSTREQVLEAGREKPDDQAMKAGLVLWALMVPALGAPIFWGLAQVMELYRERDWVEFLFGPLAPLWGALVLFLPAFWLLRRHMKKHVEALRDAVMAMSRAVGRVVDGGPDPLTSAPSIRSFMQARLVHTGALATRNYAGQVYERVLQDLTHAGRLRRSVDLQRDLLNRHAEDLGAQPSMAGAAGAQSADELDAPRENISRLFDSRTPMPTDLLVAPEHLLDYYRRHLGDVHQVDQMLERFIQEVGGFEHWRTRAPLADTERIMQHTRSRFDALITAPISRQFDFEDALRERLSDFVAAHRSNMSVGAKFMGYEGLDPDGVDILAQSTLILHPDLATIFDKVRHDAQTPSTVQTASVKAVELQPNTAYMLSLVQGIRPHSLRNLRRFESFHQRAQLPEDRLGLGGMPGAGRAAPINHMTGYESLREDIQRSVFGSPHARAPEAAGRAYIEPGTVLGADAPTAGPEAAAAPDADSAPGAAPISPAPEPGGGDA